MYTNADVTIVVLPDDRYSGVLQCLEDLARYTPALPGGQRPRLLVPDLGYPEQLREALRGRLRPPTGELIPLGRLLPMEALAQIRPRLTTPLCALVGTDIRVTPDWLGPLLGCVADGADVVTPLIVAPTGGLYPALRRVTVDGRTYLLEQRCDPAQRAPTDCFDLSCVLLRTEWLHRIELRPLSVHESVDMALQLRLGGAALVSEPGSVVLRCDADQEGGSPTLPDLLYGLFRWSSARAERSERLFQRTWGYAFYDGQALRAQLLRRRLGLLGRFVGLQPGVVERVVGTVAGQRRGTAQGDPMAGSQPLLKGGTASAAPARAVGP